MLGEPELVSNTTDKRNWRGIIIALLVILTVLGLIVTAIVLVTPKTVDGSDGLKLDFKSFMRQEYEPRVFQPIWLPGGERFLFRNPEGAVIEYDCATNGSNIIMDNSTFRELDTELFKVSADKELVLLPYDIKPIYRHSTIARYSIFNVTSKLHTDLLGPHGPIFQYVTWSPQGHDLLFVQYNDIYYLRNGNIARASERTSSVRLTFDENLDVKFNGVPDWVYEEEILSSDNAVWFSPNGSHLLYATFDDTDVRTFNMPMYGGSDDVDPADQADQYYTHSKLMAYPKPGSPNPVIKLTILLLKENRSVELAPPSDFINRDHYFTTVSWQDEDHVLVTWLNRPQNVSIVTICSARNGDCRKNHRIVADGGWVDMHSPPMFTPNGRHYFLTLPHRDGSFGSFKHIAKLTSDADITKKHMEGSRIFLTAGQWDVTKIVGYDDLQETIYFIATQKGDPKVRHLYSVTTSRDHPEFRRPTCLSCAVGDECRYVDASFTPTGRFYVLGCKGPAVPSYHLYSVERGLVRTFENNDDLREQLAPVSMPTVEYFRIPVNDDEFMWAKLLLPPVLKKEEILTYNLLFKVYGSPGSQKVTEEFHVGWEHYLSSVHGFIIAYVDGRGSGGRGERWLHHNYKNLGTSEVEDTIEAARYFGKLHYVNERLAIWGLSYGGFLTSSVLARGSGVFACGMAVAPVTDWRYYDSVYTERYMGLPTAEDNLAAYNFANVSRYAKAFQSVQFMLIHGTGDDNVHFQNSAQLIKALTEEDVYFRSQIYIDEPHWLNGGNTKSHLYNTMERFLLQCYGKPHVIVDNSMDVSEKDDIEIEE